MLCRPIHTCRHLQGAYSRSAGAASVLWRESRASVQECLCSTCSRGLAEAGACVQHVQQADLEGQAGRALGCELSVCLSCT